MWGQLDLWETPLSRTAKSKWQPPPGHPNTLRTLREKAGIRQDVFAKQLNVSAKHLFTIESGRQDPSLRLAIQICTILQCSLDDLYPDVRPLRDGSRRAARRVQPHGTVEQRVAV